MAIVLSSPMNPVYLTPFFSFSSLPVATPIPDSADAPSRLQLWLLTTLFAGVSQRWWLIRKIPCFWQLSG
jgi:hypothetical protein